jgi:flagellar biosynthetic protein FliR
MTTALCLSVSLLFVRVAAFVGVMPIFGTTNVPRIIKVGLAVALTLTWVDYGAALGRSGDDAVSLSWVAYLVAVGKEALLGGMLGYMLGLVLVPARVAGDFISQQMGMTLAILTDPTSPHTAAGIVTQILEVLSIVLFLGLDGDHLVLGTFNNALRHWPVGNALAPLPLPQIIDGSGLAVEWGLQIAAPVVFCLFISSIVLALMARAAPQLNFFSVGFSLQVGIGLAGLALLVPQMAHSLLAVFGRLSEVFGVPG